MSTYLEKLRAKKRQKSQAGEVQKQQKAKASQKKTVGPGAITAKTPSCTFCSTPKRPFSGNVPLPGWCRANCPHLRRVELDDLPPVTACYQRQSPTSWTWARLDRLNACPLTTESAPPPISALPMPPTTGPEVSGLPCGGCGSTRYRKVADGFVYPDGSRADGWHCGGSDCHVKLMVERIGT